MIPVAILVGLLARRWWAAPLVGLAWASWLAVDEACDGDCFAAAAVVGAINAVAGVAVAKTVEMMIRRPRARHREKRTDGK